MEESENKIEYSEELLKLIDEVVRENPGIGFRICNTCGRKFPIHRKFFIINKACKDGILPKCRRCNSERQNILDNLNPELLIQLYEEILVGKRKKFPDGTLQNKDHLVILIRYLFLEKLKLTNDDIFKIQLSAILKKYRLTEIAKSGDVYNFFKNSLPEYKIYPWYLFEVEDHYWDNNENVKIAQKWFVDKLFKDNIINELDNLPKMISKELIERYNLGSLLRLYFNNNIYDFINYIYPNKWMPFELNKCSQRYWETKDNAINAVKWLINNKLKLISRNDIIKVNSNDFKNNGIITALTRHYNGSVYLALSEVFPELNIHEWELTVTPNGYWSLESNRILALKQLIEEVLKLEKSEIPDIISYTYLRDTYPKFCSVLEKFYKYNIFDWIDKVYPEVYKPSDFNLFITKDGIKVGSKDERRLHSFFKKYYKGIDIKYTGNKRKNYKIYNEKYDEYYIVDWIMNNNIKIEYFGMYNLKKEKEVFRKYVLKTHRKIEFFNKYCKENNQYFIALFPDDLKNNFKGVINKVNIILNGINKEVINICS